MDKGLSKWVAGVLVFFLLFTSIAWSVAEKTTAAPAEALSQYKTLTVGYNGSEVAVLKQRMFELGYKTANTADESYTAQTNAYVREFEKVNHLPVDGIADPEMQALLFSDLALRSDGSPAILVVEPPLNDEEKEVLAKRLFSDFLAGTGEFNDFKLQRALFVRSYELDLGLMSCGGTKKSTNSTVISTDAHFQSILLFHTNIDGEEIMALGIKNRIGERKITAICWPVRSILDKFHSVYINKQNASSSYNDGEVYKTEEDIGLALDRILGFVIKMTVDYDPLEFTSLTGDKNFETNYKSIFAHKKDANQKFLSAIWRPERKKLPAQTNKLLESFGNNYELFSINDYEEFIEAANYCELYNLPYAISISHQ